VRKTAITLIVLVVVLGGLFVVADRVSASAAESTISDQAVKEMNARQITSPDKPHVSVGGFPFLTQVLRGRYDKVTIKVNQPRYQNNVKLEQITLVAAPVRAPLKAITSHQGQVTADTVTGTATMTWDEVRSLLDLAGIPGIDPSKVQLTVVDNQVRLRIPLSALGQTVTVTAGGTLTVANGQVRFQVSQLTPEGDNVPSVVTDVINRYKSRLSVTVKVPAMPYKLTVRKVQTSNDGVVATASADNVVLAG
jgi:LmeA-like phospholipid-binding